jgi:hypothetical protein
MRSYGIFRMVKQKGAARNEQSVRFEVLVEQVTSDGDMRYLIRFQPIGAAPSASFDGASGRIGLTTRGIAFERSGIFQGNAPQDEVLRGVAGLLAVSLPREAIGIGGAWRQVGGVGGALATQSEHSYQLVSRTPESAKITVAGTRSRAPSAAQQAGAQQILDYHAEEAGEFELRPDRPMPERAHMRSVATLTLRRLIDGRSVEEKGEAVVELFLDADTSR